MSTIAIAHPTTATHRVAVSRADLVRYAREELVASRGIIRVWREELHAALSDRKPADHARHPGRSVSLTQALAEVRIHEARAELAFAHADARATRRALSLAVRRERYGR